MKPQERKSLVWFFSITTIIAIASVVYLFYARPEGLLLHIIPAYFLSVIGAYFTVFVLRKKMKTGKFRLKWFTLFIIILSLLLAIYLVSKYLAS